MIRATANLDLAPATALRQGALKRATRIGLSRAASPVKGAVVSSAAAIKRYGYLRRSIRMRLRGYPADRWVAVVGPSTKATYKKRTYTRGKRKGEARVFKPSKYAHLVERGTTRSKARPFLEPAFNATKSEFLTGARAHIDREIQAALQRVAAKKVGKP